MPPGGLPNNIFNPFGDVSTRPQDIPANQPQAGIGTAGRYAEAVKRALEAQKQFGMDPKDPMSAMFAMNMANQFISNDPEILKEQAGIYEGIQNRLADAANERAMKGHIFAGLLNLPNKWQEAMAEKYRFVQPTLQMAQEAGASRSPFQARQYINI